MAGTRREDSEKKGLLERGEDEKTTHNFSMVRLSIPPHLKIK